VAFVAALVLLGAGGVIVVTRSAGHDHKTATAVASPPTGPTFEASTSASNVPPTTSTTIDAAAARLSARLDAVMADTGGCLVAADGPLTLYAHLPQGSFAPASTEKLLVAAAALSLLGPDFRFQTRVVAQAAPRGGQVGSLWLVGSGDPLLATPEFAAYTAGQSRVRAYPFTPLSSLADALVAAGITSVPEGVHGDDSYFDKLRWLPAWPDLYKRDKEIGALSALTVNEGIALVKPVIKLTDDPAGLASSELARLLVARHVAVVAGPNATAPAHAVVVARVASAPLSQIVEAMLRASDNLIAELLVRELDRAAGGTGTTVGGLAVLVHQDAALGLPVDAVHLDDGSGLAPTDRASCPLLLAALDVANRPGLQAIRQGLAVAGQTGTLDHRFIGTPEAGRLVAKTGSIQNVAGLVGVLDLTRPVRFALLINQPGTENELLAKEDQVVAVLATYPG
jgi:serine-type D-Ala-D-Ala carboxypeptidase/endopeptidase (penicillin-binding protein 4)